MKYWVKDLNTGKVYVGKANSWNDVSCAWYRGERLYNPYAKQTVYGWNDYKKSLRDSWNRRKK